MSVFFSLMKPATLRNLLVVMTLMLSGCGADIDPGGRPVAEWIVKNGGQVTLTGSTLVIKEAAKLPKGDLGIAKIELKKTRVTNDDLQRFSNLRHVVYLGLHQTSITDEGLEHLLGLQSLQSLELSNTQITDDGLKKLASLSGLKKLFVSNTLVTADSAKQFRETNPECNVVRY